MAAEEENTELVDQHGHGYGLDLAYGMDLGSTTHGHTRKGNKEITTP